MKKQNLFILLIILVSSLSFVSCDKNDEVEGSIYGIVTTSGEPLKGIGVSLFLDDALLLKTVTYDDGSYEFANLKPGHYTLMVEDEKYDKFTTTVVVEAGRQARADMKLTYKDIYLTVSTVSAGLSGSSVTMIGKYSIKYQGYSPHEYGFYYGSSPNPSKTGAQVTGKYTSYQFEAKVTNLTAGTYYYQAYAKNDRGIVYGDVLTFSFSGEPVVQTLEASDVTETSAILNGKVLYEGAPVYTERGFIYSVNYVTPTITEGTVIKISGSGEGEFSYKLTGLIENETYYVRAYVKNQTGVVYGDVIKFKCSNNLYAIIDYANLMVQRNDLGYTNYKEALDACKKSYLGGFTDWRLPTLAELKILYDNRKAIGNFKADYYWCDNSDRSDGFYYSLDFYNGTVYYRNYSSSINNVRAVRTITN